MTMKLYYVPMTRAVRPRWMLEELGVPYELVRLDAFQGETKSAEYLKVNPLGHVPALVDDGVTIAESAAICLYLADKFPEKKLAPSLTSKDRGPYLQWAFHAMTSLEPPIAAFFRLGRAPDDQKDSAGMEAEKKKLIAEAKTLDETLAGRTFLIGDSFTAADVIVSNVMTWGRRMKMFGAADLPHVDAWLQRLRERPALARASAD